ncbi:hypothetical protein SAMN04487894_101607 [Niabella drilacis]|uniref:Uncharacterized protein n=1 Tax=Niabella drilacis (strain DSM 25811 / CCM 8410 / CCUG 62505 / LMG 26954 / E90) TaxID=1285928 RepID=A0A1G6JRC6_NIADE|nr:hypothetical protein SAMN04487894_101607 [Niabella drilacis]
MGNLRNVENAPIDPKDMGSFRGPYFKTPRLITIRCTSLVPS